MQYVFVNLSNNKYLFVLAGVLFAISASLDPLYHEVSSHDIAEVECQFCENEVYDTSISRVSLLHVSFVIVLKEQIKQQFFSQAPKSYNSRAPPKI
jgi:hypothetical protein